MTRQSKILLVSATCVIVVAVVIVAIQTIQFSRNFNRRIVNLTDEQARLMIRNELPAGTSKFRVKQFLDSKKWPYGDRDNGSTIQTMIHDAEQNGLIRTDIQIQFHFNSDDKLISYEIKDIHTGP